MDLTRFIALLERRALYFSALRNLPDKFEGVRTPNLVAQARAMPGLEHGMEMTRLMMYVNCWNEGVSESVALWNMYASQAGGVAIRSSFGAMQDALPSPEPMREEAPGFPRDELRISRVRYIDFRTAEIPSGNAMWPVTFKRLPFGFEHEVRLLVSPFDLNEQVAAVANDRMQQMQGALTADDSNKLIRDTVCLVAPAGYDVDIDPGKLIQEIVVAPEAPDWLLDLIRDVTKRYDIEVPIKRSDLDAPVGY